MLDIWRCGEHGAVLFWVNRDLDLWGFGHATLHLVEGQRVDGVWRTNGGGGWGTLSAAEYIADDGPGLHNLGGGGDPMRFTIAVASPEVSSIELRSDQDVSSRSPGAEGFCLLGISERDPITYARGLDADGQPVGSESLLL